MLAWSCFRLTSLVRLSPQATSDRLEQGQGLGGWGEERGSGGQLQTQISLQRWGQLLLQPFSLISRARLLACLGTRVALTAPWSLSLGGGLASSPRQSPLIHLKPQAAFAEWDFKQ